MSIVICRDCDRFVDSDDDPDCFVYDGNYKRQQHEIVLCSPCRDKRENLEWRDWPHDP